MSGRGRRASAGPSPASQPGSARRSSRRNSKGTDQVPSPNPAQENVQPNTQPQFPVEPSPAKSQGASQLTGQDPVARGTQSQDPAAAPALDLNLGTDSQDPLSEPQASQQRTPSHSMQGAPSGSAAPSGSQGFAYGATPSTAGGRSNPNSMGMYSVGHVPSSNYPENSAGVPNARAGGGTVDDTTFMWGTGVTVADLKYRLRKFFREFKGSEAELEAEPMDIDAEEEEGDGLARRPKYMKLLIQAIRDEEFIVNVDGHDLHAHSAQLYDDLIKFPQDAIPLADKVFTEIAFQDMLVPGFEEGDADPDKDLIKTRLYNLLKVHTIRDLDPEDINKLVSVQGMVTRTSSIIPDIQKGLFLCERCGNEEEVGLESGAIQQPKVCNRCRKQWTLKLIHNRSSFLDKQIVRLQESPNQIPEGETPHTVTTYAIDEIVDSVRPGDRVTITGIYRAMPARVNPKQRVLSSMFRTYLDIVHVQRDERTRLISLADALNTRTEVPPTPGTPGTMGDDSQFMDGTQEGPQASELGPTPDPIFNVAAMTHDQIKAKTERIKELAQQEDIYDKLTRSLAPNVWGMEDVKKGILCQLFGGTQKVFPGGRIRGELNVLLVGDPGVSKSQLLGYVHQIAPRGIYTSGRGSSAVGLTAYVTKDPESGEMVLESGALVLSDKGVCCIDEFDKMSDSARSMLHEVMEQQTVSIAKAGLISTLNARTSVLASANPIDSRYDRKKSLVQNINLPPTLLSRFDLIYRILDECSRDSDRRLARHLVSLYHEHPPQQQYQDIMDKEELREYIAYCRFKCHPKISDAAEEAITAKYIQLRRSGRDRDIVAVTPRQLESLIRLSEAQAKMRFCKEVTPDHVEEAFRLWYGAMTSCAVADNGVLDMDAIATGLSAADREAARQLPQRLREIFTADPGKTWGVEALIAQLAQLFNIRVQRQQLLEAVLQLDDIATLHVNSQTISVKRSA